MRSLAKFAPLLAKIPVSTMPTAGTLNGTPSAAYMSAPDSTHSSTAATAVHSCSTYLWKGPDYGNM